MHKRLVSECLIDLEIRCPGPLLIKSGVTPLEGPDMSPVMTYRAGAREEPYIPGSSLKGVLRSHAERIARTLADGAPGAPLGACDPFRTRDEDQDRRDAACGKRLENDRDPRRGIDPELAYRESCPICKLFGSTALLGRCGCPDAYLVPGEPWALERRDGVGIDRFTGGVHGNAKFDLQVVVGARFGTVLKLTNFELWQLGLVGLVLHDMSDGLVSIGSGRSRGLGEVEAAVLSVEIRYAGNLPHAREGRLYGLRALQAGETERYRYRAGETRGVEVPGLTAGDDALGLRAVYRIGAEGVLALWSALAPHAVGALADPELSGNARPAGPGGDGGAR